jgi:hypothetical protein
MRKIIVLVMLLFPISFGVFFQVGHAKVDGVLQPENKRISEKEAGKIALQKVKGEIIRIELEEDDGKTVYEVKIKSSGTIYEVEIDAKTGQVLEVEKEGSHDGNDDRDGDDNDDGDDDHLDD